MAARNMDANTGANNMAASTGANIMAANNMASSAKANRASSARAAYNKAVPLPLLPKMPTNKVASSMTDEEA